MSELQMRAFLSIRDCLKNAPKFTPFTLLSNCGPSPTVIVLEKDSDGLHMLAVMWPGGGWEVKTVYELSRDAASKHDDFNEFYPEWRISNVQPPRIEQHTHYHLHGQQATPQRQVT